MKESTNLVEQTQKSILNYINSHPEGSQLPKERDLVNILGVSRVVIREALSSLKALGLIESKRKGGTKVISPDIFGVVKLIIEAGCLDDNTLSDLFQFRFALEIGFADIIFKKLTPAHLDSIGKIIDEELAVKEEITAHGVTNELYEKLKDLDIKFHSELIRVTENDSYINFQGVLLHLFSFYSPKKELDFNRSDIITHAILYNILKVGTADEFRMAMRLHLGQLLNDYEQRIDRMTSRV